MEEKNELVWGAIEKTVVDILHPPTRPERDCLLEKLRDKQITVNELERLDSMLRCDLDAEKGKNESIAIVLLLARIKQLMYDNGRVQIVFSNGPTNKFFQVKT